MFYVSYCKMQEWKQVVAVISVIVLLASTVLYLVMFGPVLDDPEFAAALVRAEQVGMPDVELTREYPFSPITREDAVDRYIVTAQEMEMIVYGDNLCGFDDIDELEQRTKEQILLACRYRFFLGNEGSFVPEWYLTKASSLVALVRWMYPARAFVEIDPYRQPFVTTAYELGITKRPSSPYMMYLVTKYELLLQLYRAAHLKNPI